jgi:hypothetical protein
VLAEWHRVLRPAHLQQQLRRERRVRPALLLEHQSALPVLHRLLSRIGVDSARLQRQRKV